MTVNEKVTISFELPKEFNKAMKFREQHPDYVENVTSQRVSYSMSRMYSVDGGGDNE